MNSAAGPRPSFRNTSRIQSLTANRSLRVTLWSIVVALSVLKFCYLAADFPNESPWLIDQAKFTDEGWWSNAAVAHALTGHWFVPGDYNPAVALPVWPFLISLLFRFTGVSFIAARALNVAISVATLGVVFLLLRRFARPNSGFPALLGVVLLSASPFAFAFNRLAILDTLVVFEFLLLLLLASSQLTLFVYNAKSKRALYALAAHGGLSEDFHEANHHKDTAAAARLCNQWSSNFSTRTFA